LGIDDIFWFDPNFHLKKQKKTRKTNASVSRFSTSEKNMSSAKSNSFSLLLLRLCISSALKLKEWPNAPGVAKALHIVLSKQGQPHVVNDLSPHLKFVQQVHTMKQSRHL
jgi:hypothetical protein